MRRRRKTSGRNRVASWPTLRDNVLNEVGRRVVRLHEGLCTDGDDFDHCVIRFADHKLYLRCVPHGFLCVLSTNGVNTPALKMALTLTSRRVDPLIADAAAALAAGTPSVGPRTSEPPPPPSGAPSRRQATYRGHRV